MHTHMLLYMNAYVHINVNECLWLTSVDMEIIKQSNHTRFINVVWHVTTKKKNN